MKAAAGGNASGASLDPWLDETFEEPLYVPGPDSILFGAQVGHSPARELPPPPGAVCPLCRSAGYWLADADGYAVLDDSGEPIFVPGEIAPGSPTTCSKCMRWGRDGALAALMDGEYARRGSNDPVPVSPPPAREVG